MAVVSVAALTTLVLLVYALINAGRPEPWGVWAAWAYLSLLLAGCAWALAPVLSTAGSSYFLSVMAAWACAAVVSLVVFAVLWLAFGGHK